MADAPQEQASVPVAKPAADIEDRTIPVGPTGEVRIRIAGRMATRRGCRW
jgi:hypothetical protein